MNSLKLTSATALLASLLFSVVRGDGSCPCPDEKQIRIGGVSHGVATDSFWDNVYAAAFRSAKDNGVELDFERFEGVAKDEPLTQVMVDRITSLCSDSSVDGIFATLYSKEVLDTLMSQCVANDVPTVAINSGIEKLDGLKNNGGLLHFVGTNDYNTGYSSGSKLSTACPDCSNFICVDHCSNCSSWNYRCNGFSDATATSKHILANISSTDAYISSIETAVCEGKDNCDDWSDVGLLLGVQSSLFAFAEALVNKYPEVKVAGIDTSPELFSFLDGDSSGFLWGTDQQPYLQGYSPVQLLAGNARMGQSFTTFDLETGPKFIRKAPSGEKLCTSNPFVECKDTSTASSFAASFLGSASFSLTLLFLFVWRLALS